MASTDLCRLRRADLAEDILTIVTQVALLREYAALTAEALVGVREFLTPQEQEVLDSLDPVKATKAAEEVRVGGVKWTPFVRQPEPRLKV
jgi:hypothetical protein